MNRRDNNPRGIAVFIVIAALIAMFVVGAWETIVRQRQAANKTPLMNVSPVEQQKPTTVELADDGIDTLKEYIEKFKEYMSE